MIGSIGSNSGSNWYSIGNVSSYAKNLVNSYVSKNGTNNISGFLNSAQSTTDNTVKNTMLFANTNKLNMNNLKNAAQSLNSAAKSLDTGVKQLTSSDKNVVSATSGYGFAVDSEVDVKVSQVAKQQTSKSAEMDSFAQSFETGSNSISISTKDGNYNIGFDVKQGESNESVLNKIAAKINTSQAGVTASVVSEDGKSSIKMTSVNTGESAAFAVESVGGGSAAEKLKMQAEQTAQDAKYSVNGQSFTSESNTVAIPNGKGASMTLTGVGSASISKNVDTDNLVSTAKKFAEAYNTAMAHLTSGKADGPGVSKAIGYVADNRLTAMSMEKYGSSASARLGAMGIGIDSDGKMQVDEKALSAAAKESPASVKNALSGFGGLASATMDNAQKAANIPASTFTDFSKMSVSNSLVDMMMKQNSTGLLFSLGL